MADTAIETTPDLVVSVVRVPIGGYPYFQPAVYETHNRKSDGAKIWRRRGLIEKPTRSRDRALNMAYEYSQDRDVSFDPSVRHNTPVHPNTPVKKIKPKKTRGKK